ncbi:hypothetical protein [Cognaticolwellia beringensis]|uniref:Uncharacterized protein n=1 Tax=Cognaticolwellia beringensis TaxID=1967665 RepID=A0A222G7H2_9GAMM|nr:hypothetical protein [Cognaticolwellia beringensis]ASP47761.1 hypothetical protein B5D82_08350 [Cognaticolwellia beringensis]
MTKLNKIAQVLVLSGVSCWVSIAQASDIQISQNTSVNQQVKVSQQTSSADSSAQMSAQSDASVENDSLASSQEDNSEEGNNVDSAPSETEGVPSSDLINTDTSGMLKNNSEIIASLASNTGESVNATSEVAVTLAQSLNQVTSIGSGLLTLPESETAEASDGVTQNEDMAAENIALNQNAESATSFVNTSAVSNEVSGNFQKITAVDTTSNLSQSLNQATSADFLALPKSNAGEKSEEIASSEDMAIPENVTLNPTTDNVASFANTSQISQQISTNVQNITALDAAAQTSQALEQTVSASVTDAITSNAQMAITENVNGQVDSVVTEQINAELAAATTAEVANNLASDLDLGL